MKKNRTTRLRLTTLPLLLFLAATWLHAASWNPDETSNASHYFRSLEANRKAMQVVRKDNTDAPQLNINEANKYQQIALDEAKRVRDAVLDKAHPQLKEHFRSEYEKGLELILKSYDVSGGTRSGPPSKSQVDLQASGVRLLKLWAAWFNAHEHEIRMPKQGTDKAH